jgi:hypothetical protein
MTALEDAVKGLNPPMVSLTDTEPTKNIEATRNIPTPASKKPITGNETKTISSDSVSIIISEPIITNNYVSLNDFTLNNSENPLSQSAILEYNQHHRLNYHYKVMLTKLLLEHGFTAAESTEEARYQVHPLIHFADIDDNQYTLGIPSVPIPLANMGTVNTPELALLGLHAQYGREKVSIVIIDRLSKKLVGSFESAITESNYKRWKLLLFLGWRTTSLPKPF